MKINYFIAHLFAILIYLIECRSYYDILGVKKDESTGGIKKAFRNLALKYHPDKVKNPDKKTEENFREIVAAYEVLSDPDKRKMYDMTGSNTNGNQHHQHHRNNEDFNFDDFFKNFDEAFKSHHENHQRAHRKAHAEAMKKHHGFHFDFDDLFDDFAGFGGHDHIDADGFGGFGSDLHEAGDSYFSEFRETKGGKNCKTVTKKEGNTVMTHTECTSN